MDQFETFRGHKLSRIEQFGIFRGTNFHGLDKNPRNPKVCTFKINKTHWRVFLIYRILDIVEGGVLNPFRYVDAPGKCPLTFFRLF